MSNMQFDPFSSRTRYPQSFNDAAIRAYCSADLDKVAEIYKLTRPLEFQQEPYALNFADLSLTVDAATWRTFELSNILVFEEAGVIKGFAGYVYDYIAWLYVHPDHQRQGIGQRLISYILPRLEGDQARLSIVKSNQAAQACYATLGFSVKESFQFELQGHTLTGIRMLLAF